LFQFVSCDERAWHAGTSSYRGRENCNDFSIGVELEGLEGQTFESSQYDRLCILVRAVSENYPVRHLAGHSNVAPGRKIDPGPGFDWTRLSELIPQLGLTVPDH
jgi:AmpD protein